MVIPLGEVAMSFGFPVETTQEGAVRVIVPKLEAFRKGTSHYAPSRAPVFYNPAMKLNRDLAVLVLQTYQGIIGREITVSEPLAGCGVRGIRFVKEVRDVRRAHLNDINPEAFGMAQHNIQMNGLADRVFATNEDANLFLCQHAAPRRRFDCIDIDPFGSPVPYTESAVRALRDGGLLALTATDLTSLCGIYPKAALRKYGGLALRTEYSRETAVRLLAGCLATIAARHEIGVDIPFSHSANHYVRVYALARHGAKRADESIRKMGYILHCFGCFHREKALRTVPTVAERCGECGAPLKVAGPLWLGSISDKGFCELAEREASTRSIEDRKRVMRTLSLIRAESDAPATYYVVDKICDKLSVPIPSSRMITERLKEKGFQALATHFHSRGIRTNAPARVVLEATAEVAR